MALSHSPSIVTNGLVFCVDQGNTQKSWRGKPTTNFISNPTEEMARGEFGQYRDLAPIFNANGLVPYSLSMDIKVNKPGSVNVYMQNGSATKYSFVSQSVSATTVWQRFYFNNLTPAISTPSETAAILATYTGYGSGINPTVRNIQLELGTFATPFVDGTRSNTQSILDIVGKNTVTANSLTYNSDGSFSFTTGNYALAPLTKAASTTFSFWANSSIATPAGMLFNAGPSGVGPDLYFSGGSIYWNIWDGAANPFGAIPASAGDGKYHQYVVVNDASTNAKLYYDGALYGTATYRNASLNTNFAIGGGGAGDYNWSGKIAVASLYNKALTQAEVLQNFNALRGRFGV